MKKDPTRNEWLGVAIGVTEQGQISPTHFGDSDRLILARIQASAYELLDNIPNPLKNEEEGHAHKGKLEKAKTFLEGVQIIATGKASVNFKRLQAKNGKWPVVSDKDPKALLVWLSEHLDDLEVWFSDPDKGVFRT